MMASESVECAFTLLKYAVGNSLSGNMSISNKRPQIPGSQAFICILSLLLYRLFAKAYLAYTSFFRWALSLRDFLNVTIHIPPKSPPPLLPRLVSPHHCSKHSRRQPSCCEQRSRKATPNQSRVLLLGSSVIGCRASYRFLGDHTR